MNVDFDREQFDKQCQEIIENIKDRFIDLAPTMIDDEQNNYIEQI